MIKNRKRTIRQRKAITETLFGLALMAVSAIGFVAWAFWYMPALYAS